MLLLFMTQFILHPQTKGSSNVGYGKVENPRVEEDGILSMGVDKSGINNS